MVRRILSDRVSSELRPQPLPLRFMGANVVFSGSTGHRMQGPDCAFCQGTDTSTDAFMLVAVQDTPDGNQRESHDTYLCRVVVSSPFPTGLLGEA